MNYIILTAIAVFTVFLSTFIGYLIPMMYREQKFKKYWTKCPHCDKNKKKKEIYNVFNFWKYGGYCDKHKPKPIHNILFTVFLTALSMFVFVFEYIMTKSFFTPNSVCFYVVTIMLVYATYTDFKGLVIPDACHIVIFAVGLFTMFFEAISTNNNAIYLERVIGMFCIALPLFLLCLLGKSGFGDVKMFATLGLFLGWKKLLLVLLIAVLSGLVYALYKRISSKNLKWKSEVPFGPFICLGTYITMLFGNQMINAYMQLFK